MKKAAITPDNAEDFFWKSIDKANKKKRAHWSNYDADEHLETLTTLLSTYDKQALILFEKVLQEKLYQLYTAEIAELSIILECEFTKEDGKVVSDDYLSDDGFIYFRCWLLLKGQAFFDDITTDISTFVSGKYSFNIGDPWAEGLLYVSDNAYAVHHANDSEAEIKDAVAEEFPEVIHYDSLERKMNREPRGGAELQAMSPNLVEEMSMLRSQ